MKGAKDITLTLTVYMGKSIMKGAMDITLTLTVYMGKSAMKGEMSDGYHADTDTVYG